MIQDSRVNENKNQDRSNCGGTKRLEDAPAF
jgi:hypothetical protein